MALAETRLGKKHVCIYKITKLMFQIVKISGISDFTRDDEILFTSNGKEVYADNKQIISEALGSFGPFTFFCFDNHLYVQDWNGNYVVYQSGIEKVGTKVSFFPINGRKMLGKEFIENGKVFFGLVENGDLLWIKEIELFNHFNVANDKILVLKKNRFEIVCLTLKNGKELFNYVLPNGKYDWMSSGAYAELVKGEIQKIQGVYKEVLWIGLNSGRLLGLDSNTGKLLYDLLHPRNGEETGLIHGNYFTPGQEARLDEAKGVLFGLFHRYYWEIDLDRPNDTYFMYKIENHTASHNIESLRLGAWQGSEIVFYQSFFAQDLTYVGIFNRERREIIWTSHELGDEGLFKGIKKIEYKGGKLYILDMAGTLHLFEI